MAKKIVLLSFCVAIVCIVAASMWSTHADAQDTSESAAAGAAFLDFKHLALLIIESVVFSIVGVIVLMVGYKIFDLVTPFDLNHQIAEDNNTAAGIAVAGVIIALGLIVSAAVA